MTTLRRWEPSLRSRSGHLGLFSVRDQNELSVMFEFCFSEDQSEGTNSHNFLRVSRGHINTFKIPGISYITTLRHTIEGYYFKDINHGKDLTKPYTVKPL